MIILRGLHEPLVAFFAGVDSMLNIASQLIAMGESYDRRA